MIKNDILLSSVYLAGILSFFSPCIFPIIPVYFGILSNGVKNQVLKTILFIIGLSTSFIILGFGAGIVGSLINSEKFRFITSIFIIILGLFQTELIRVQYLEKTKIITFEEKKNQYLSSYLLGFGFSLGWTPCIGPILTSILFISGGGGDPKYGALLMFIYVSGLTTPFIIISLSSKYLLNKLSFIKRYLNVIKKIGGILIIIMGILLMMNQLNIFIY